MPSRLSETQSRSTPEVKNTTGRFDQARERDLGGHDRREPASEQSAQKLILAALEPGHAGLMRSSGNSTRLTPLKLNSSSTS